MADPIRLPKVLDQFRSRDLTQVERFAGAETEDLRRRVLLALSILQHREWGEREWDACQVIQALLGDPIEDIAKGPSRWR